MSGIVNDEIEPALRSDEWADPERIQFNNYVRVTDVSIVIDGEVSRGSNDVDVPKLIALLNDALPDSDRRKMTRERVVRLYKGAVALDRLLARHEEWPVDGRLANEIRAFADALLSYVPPESIVARTESKL